MTSLADAHEVLARHGIAPGPRGYDVATLAAAAAARGWGCCAEERRNRGARYQALVFARTERVANSDPAHVSSLFSRARGATEAEALAKALARLLLRAA